MAQYKYKPVKKLDTPQIEDTSIAIKEFTPQHPLDVVLGIDKDNEVVFTDLEKLPHLLIGGTTGSGKSNFVHSIISCLIKNKPEDLGLILIDPKQVEFSCYENLPHLLSTIGSDEIDAIRYVKAAYEETKRRYALFKNMNVKNIHEYNKIKKLHRVVIIIDEIADILYDNENLKDLLVATAQLSRAAGIHFIIATQRPSADIIDGRIKANFPARVAFKCASVQDSMIVLGTPGAEKIQRCGDFIYKESGIGAMVEARAIWLPTEHTRSLAASTSTHANENIQSLIAKVSGVNVDDITTRYAESRVSKADLKATLRFILINNITNINKDKLIDVVINGQVRDKIMRILSHDNIINDKGNVNLLAIERVIKTRL